MTLLLKFIVLKDIKCENLDKKIVYWLFLKSFKSVNKQRKLNLLKEKLEEICPDLSDQYSGYKINMDDEYVVNKIRYQHTLQVALALKAVDLLGVRDKITIRDIGDIGDIRDIRDSAGTHILYLQKILEENGIVVDSFSVNLDEKATKKIQKKGLKAIHCRAEDLHEKENVEVGIFLSYEMIEHLFNPIAFLNSVAKNTDCEYFVITVPNVYCSRAGFSHVRDQIATTKGLDAESTHISELSPDDWNLFFQFSGWEIVYQDRYVQYPSWNLLTLTRYLWRKFDFDGFHGVFLKKNSKFSDRYTDW